MGHAPSGVHVAGDHLSSSLKSIRLSTALATSPGSGKRPSLLLEKISSSSYVTSKTPSLPLTRAVETPKRCSSSSASLAARGL